MNTEERLSRRSAWQFLQDLREIRTLVTFSRDSRRFAQAARSLLDAVREYGEVFHVKQEGPREGRT